MVTGVFYIEKVLYQKTYICMSIILLSGKTVVKDGGFEGNAGLVYISIKNHLQYRTSVRIIKAWME